MFNPMKSLLPLIDALSRREFNIWWPQNKINKKFQILTSIIHGFAFLGKVPVSTPRPDTGVGAGYVRDTAEKFRTQLLWQIRFTEPDMVMREDDCRCGMSDCLAAWRRRVVLLGCQVGFGWWNGLIYSFWAINGLVYLGNYNSLYASKLGWMTGRYRKVSQYTDRSNEVWKSTTVHRGNILANQAMASTHMAII